MQLALEYIWEIPAYEEDDEGYVVNTWLFYDIKHLWWDWIPHITHQDTLDTYDFRNNISIQAERQRQKKAVQKVVPNPAKKNCTPHVDIRQIENRKKQCSLVPELANPTGLDLVTHHVWLAFQASIWNN